MSSSKSSCSSTGCINVDLPLQCSSKSLCSSAGCISIERYKSLIFDFWLLFFLGGGRCIATCVAVYPSVHRPDVFGTSMGPLVFFFLVC